MDKPNIGEDGFQWEVGMVWKPIETAPKERELDLWCAYGRAIGCRWGLPTFDSGEYGKDGQSVTDMKAECWITDMDDCYGVAVPSPSHWMFPPDPPS